ncbi:hypothetical protein A2334_02415 [Candidatus Roizmanbacteria bacterium RIFOXYB2_FULL_38_10]|uniref:Uncharacterized protein n=1 Tax=Candidatus Roizmanbacteria bacterium RIFOXYD1_FULL_38_12 TaxID=1802093 RepID=A0A1F7L007_9BACT|nr:MAG: hypothetical protein A3K47_01555 [Candidatus Roizmanbacteria bacterium RIFOXYA2_FULL_38_14]OGK63470.1 MAG: hypothetical protein A3K27_01555 [Candidatus Roizmanbacteria bacterium RIFOXYA1_FULL_37_12]OGK65316.1 MAG: hypothetical protein A3K38_01555 [Candidatus Roizmanbacteria bacterium RIFOXYB1_FULL_40_23]OGK67970.1 MAG: hypothetical protein A2334_02415 [Candidatus Roizmanbacteria bacterium RIFOXYB2_FULL_38_10]OGK69721.1 MAG: hypothetical protein A3K21_01560 [Candidatus Roizmanbacteria ba
MEHKTTDINDLVEYLASTAMRPLLDDEVWRAYGYKKRPKSGNILHKLFPDKFELEDFITKEVLTMGLIDVLNGVKKSKISSDEKLLIALGVLDQFISTTKHMFDPNSFVDNLLTAYDSYTKSDKAKIHEPVIVKSKDVLNKKNFAKFMVGTISLLGTSSHEGDYFLKSSVLKDTIDNTSIENKLKLSMPEEMYRKYGDMLSKKVLNI